MQRSRPPCYDVYQCIIDLDFANYLASMYVIA